MVDAVLLAGVSGCCCSGEEPVVVLVLPGACAAAFCAVLTALVACDINELSRIANPLICVGCSIASFISNNSVVPLFVDPRRTAAGCAWEEEGIAALGTGRIPSA